MAKTKKTGGKSKRAVPTTKGGYLESSTFVRGLVWLFTALSLVYLAVAYWRFS